MRRRGRLQRGVTLIELMIGMAVGLVVISALAYVYLGSRSAYQTSDSVARVQESGRFALDFMVRDIRGAGYLGCQSRTMAPVDVAMIAFPALGFAGPVDAVRGFENGSGWVNPAPTITRPRGDVIVVRQALGAGVEIAADADIVNARITLANNAPSFRRGDYVMISDCQRVAVVRITNTPAASGTNVVIEHQAFDGADRRNGVAAIANSHRLPNPFEASARASVFRFDEVTYFIGNNPAGRPALYRVSSMTGAEEVADNIEDLDIQYGLDNGNDGTADSYVDASAIAAGPTWGQVVSVRISLVAVSAATGAVSAPQTYVFRGASVTAPDTRLRQVYSSTISLRNRMR